MTDPVETIDPVETMTEPARVPNVRPGAVSGLAGVPLGTSHDGPVAAVESSPDLDVADLMIGTGWNTVKLGYVFDSLSGIAEGLIDLGYEDAVGVVIPAAETFQDRLDWVRWAPTGRESRVRANAIWQHEKAAGFADPVTLLALFAAVVPVAEAEAEDEVGDGLAVADDDDPDAVPPSDVPALEVPAVKTDVAGLLAWVDAGQDPNTIAARARMVLDAEVAQTKPRVTLTEALEKILSP